MFEGILAVLTSSFEILASRKILGSGKFKSEKFVACMFMGVVCCMLPFMPWLFEVTGLTWKYVLIFIAILVVAASYNVLYFKSLKRIKVENAQPIVLSSWIFTIIFGFIFIPAERDVLKLILALIATLTLIATEAHGKEFRMGKWEKMMLFASILIGLYNLLTKMILDVTNPFTLYFVRTLFLLPLFVYISKFKKKEFKKYVIAWVIAIASIMSQVATLWSYDTLGLITTSLIMTLTPVFTLWGAHIFLKEEIEAKNSISTAIILLCIIGALFV